MYLSSFFWIILTVSLLFFETYSVNANPPAGDSRFSSATESATDNQIELMVPSHQGLVSWRAVAVEVANTLRLDPTAIQKLFPSGQIDLGSDGASLILLGLDLAMGESVSLSLVHPDGGPPSLRLRIDRRALGLPTSPAVRTATIEIDEDWQQRATNKPMLVCLHGLYSGPDVFTGLRSVARDTGFATAAISYDDRRAIVDTANDISIQFDRLLTDVRENVRLILVGHSMGGLVAREWTENRTLKGDCIVGLITVGTPHGGSNWAVLPPVLDLFDGKRIDASRLPMCCYINLRHPVFAICRLTLNFFSNWQRDPFAKGSTIRPLLELAARLLSKTFKRFSKRFAISTRKGVSSAWSALELSHCWKTLTSWYLEKVTARSRSPDQPFQASTISCSSNSTMVSC